MRAQRWPLSVGARFLDADRLEVLHEVDVFDKFRLGLGPSASVVLDSGERRCSVCLRDEYGLIHQLAICPGSDQARCVYLLRIDAESRRALVNALPGDWPCFALSPHQGLRNMDAAVKFVAEIARVWEKNKMDSVVLLPYGW